VDLPNDKSDPFTDGRDEKVDGSDGKGAVNAPIHVFTVGTPAAAPPSQTPSGDPPMRIWHRRLIAEAVGTIVYSDPI
jgi:hypothetical protein